MNILMLNPPFLDKFSRSQRSPAVTKSGTLYYPIWLAYATGALEERGFPVKLVDAEARGYSLSEALDEVQDFNPHLIVIDTSTPSIYNDVKVAEAMKDTFKQAYVVLVGTHVSALPTEVLSLSDKIDAVARREYDETLCDLAFTLDSQGDLTQVAGISFRQGNEIIHNPDRKPLEDLDSLPFVSKVYRKHLRIEDYFYAICRYPQVAIVTGRGCPYRCTYCLFPQTLHGRKVRYRRVESVVDELEFIANELPQVKEVFIEDDTLTVNKKRCLELSDEILRRGLKITWTANSRADIDLETLKSLKAAGCRLLCVGVESGVQEILDNIHKGIKLDQIRQFMRDAKKAKVLIHGCFLVGGPGETKETLKKTLDFAKELNPDTVQFFPLMVYPGTEAYEWAKTSGYLTTLDFSQWLTPEGLHNCVVSRPGLSNKELVAFCDEARRRFYLRPRYILGKLKQSLTNSEEARRTFKSSRTFFRYLFRLS